MRLENIPSDLFLFQLENQQYIRGESDTIYSAPTLRKAILFFVMLFVMIGLPIAIMISLVFSFFVGNLFNNVLLILGITVFSCAYVAIIGYRKQKQLLQTGRIAIGEVTKYDRRLSFSRHGYKPATRMHYKFMPVESGQIAGYKLVGISDTLRDGRKLPQVGTKIAIMYSDDKWHSPL